MRADGTDPPAAPPSEPIAHLHLHAEAEGVRAALARMRAALGTLDLTPDCLGDIELVLAEVLNNIVTHAYGDRPGPVEVTLTRRGDELLCEVRDSGRPMPGGEAPPGAPARLDVGPGALPEGGFGWFLIRRHARTLRYGRHGDTNRLTLSLPLRRNGEPTP